MAGRNSYGGTPTAEEARYYGASPSPTPSPRAGYGYYASTPQRPATRAGHSRHMSSGGGGAGAGYDFISRPPTASPRYTSDGRYATSDKRFSAAAATPNVSASRNSSRKDSWPGQQRPVRERRSSISYYRASDSHGESDEDEYYEIDGVIYMVPAGSKSKRYSSGGRGQQRYTYEVHEMRNSRTDGHVQGGYSYLDRDAGYESPRYQPQPVPAEPRRSHSRRASTSMPQRCQTARPGSSHRKPAPTPAPAPAPAATRTATEADAKKHHIPAGYSLKNWDPTEEPIMLLGSVFDSNSLGKWIYDWTVFCRGTDAPIAHMAGDLWLLLIELGGKIKHAENTVPQVRTAENKELIEDFIDSGERVMDKLRELLKSAEAPMLKSSASKKEKKTQLGKNAGVEFVETLFGRERELRRTELFMQGVRTWNHRFTVNCEAILANPGL